MANQTISTGNTVIKFRSDFFREYIREGRFSAESGNSNDNIIVRKADKKIINISQLGRLSSQGKSGSSTLRGSGEIIPDYNHRLTPTYYRNAVEVDKEVKDKPAFDILMAAKPATMDWAQELNRDQTIMAMGAVSSAGTYVDYGDAAVAQLNVWAVANSDRVLYGTTTGNYSGVHATDLAKVDTTADRATGDILGLLKRLAKNARPRIRPQRVDGGKEYFTAYCDSYVFRDIQSDLQTSHQNADVRGRNNYLFTDGDIVWNGIVIKELPEIGDFIDGGTPIVGEGNETGADWSSLATAGASTTRVSPIFLCGQQSIGVGFGQAPKHIIDDKWDFEFQPGVAIECKHDIDKLFFNDDIQHGIVTGWVSAPISA